MSYHDFLVIMMLRGWAFNRWLANVRDQYTDSEAAGFVEGAD